MRMPSESEEAREEWIKPPEEREKAVVEFRRNYEAIGKPFEDRPIACFDTDEEAVEYAKDVNLHGSENFWDKVVVYSKGIDDIPYVRHHGEEDL